MFNERTALEKLFNQLDDARELRYKQYLDEIQAIEAKQTELLNDLRRIDDSAGVHVRIHTEAQQHQERTVTADIKKPVAATDQNLVPTPPPSKNDRTEPDPGKGPGPQTEKPERNEIPERAMSAVYKDGKKILPSGNIHYQTYYICPGCKDRGKLFLPANAFDCFCRMCNKKMKVKYATSKGFPHQDDYGNHFIAGSFIRTEDKNQISLDNPVDKIMERYNKERAGTAAKEVAAAKNEAATDEDAPTNEEETAIAAAFKESAKFNMG